MKLTDLKTGDIVSVRMPLVWYKPVRYVSWGIRKVLKFYYNHTAIVINVWDKPYIAESTKGGVRIISFDKWSKDYIISIKRQNAKINYRLVADRIMEYQGFTGYDYWALLVDHIILQTTGLWDGKKGEDASIKLYCSEYVSLCFKEDFPKWYKTTPKDIYERDDLFKEIYQGKAKDLK